MTCFIDLLNATEVRNRRKILLGDLSLSDVLEGLVLVACSGLRLLVCAVYDGHLRLRPLRRLEALVRIGRVEDVQHVTDFCSHHLAEPLIGDLGRPLVDGLSLPLELG